MNTFKNNQKGYLLLIILFMMGLMAVTALALNRRAGLQARMAANQVQAVQTNFGQMAAIEHAVWKLKQNNNWRTAAKGEDYVYNGTTYILKALNSSIPGYTDAITITVTAPGGKKEISTSFRVISSPQEDFYLISDGFNNRIRKVDASGTITTIAGTGTAGFSGDGGPATSANLECPHGLHMDKSGNIFIADFLNSCVRRVDAETQIITTVAGIGNSPGYSGDGGPATSAQFYLPWDVFVDSSGNIYITDRQDNRIRKVDASGIITTFAGTGKCGASGDGGQATEAKLCDPRGVWVDTSGNVYFSDSGNSCVRKVDPSGIINTIAGTINKAGYSGDGGPATSAKLDSPADLHMDASGNLYIADFANSNIRKVDTSGIITTFAGTGIAGYSGDGGPATKAMLYWPWSVGSDASGNILIGDVINDVIRKVDGSGIITTVAGTGIGGYSGDGGPATSANINGPYGVLGYTTSLIRYRFIADTQNHCIRKVDDQGVITTVAGTGTAGYSGDGGPATSAQLKRPADVFVDASGNIYIADAGNHCIRKVDAKPPHTINTIAGTGTPGISGDGGPATLAQLTNPTDVFVQSTGRIFIADTLNNRIRKVEPTPPHTIITIVGTGTPGDSGDGGPATLAMITKPAGLFVQESGRVFFTDSGNNRIRKVEPALPHIISTIAGTGTPGDSGDGGPATLAMVKHPVGLFVDSSGGILIADTQNNRIRKVDGTPPHNISTIAGTGTPGYSGDTKPATSAQLTTPFGVFMDSSGCVYIADTGNERIRRVDPSGVITTVAGNGIGAYSGDGGPATSASIKGAEGVWVHEFFSFSYSSSLEKVTEMYWRFD